MNKIIKKYSFFSFFVFVNLIFIFLLIYKKSLFSHLNYERQKLEQQIEELTKQKQKTEQDLLILKNPKEVQKYVRSKLGMQKVRIDQVSRLKI